METAKTSETKPAGRTFYKQELREAYCDWCGQQTLCTRWVAGGHKTGVDELLLCAGCAGEF
jgi:hypothetical protein